MRKTRILLGAVVGVGAFAWWSNHRRSGAEWVNRVADPWLVGHGLVDKSRGEIGLIEHVGRRSGIVRVTPVRPVPTEAGFRIVVPLGLQSEWAQNVLAAGHCRLRIGEQVYELDEPLLVSPLAVAGLSPSIAHATDLLGFRYLLLHRFDEAIAGDEPESEREVGLEVDEELVPV
jgi:deazaflavin-dependent oxidoreductase (nitroreductase family)